MSSDLKNIKGGKELQAMLDSLPAKLEANVMRSALRQGAKVIEAEAKRNLESNGSVDSGELFGSVRVSTRSRRGVVTATVRAGNRKAWWWRWVEFGTSAHNIAGKKGGFLSFGGLFRKSVTHPGAKAKPFMRPALDSKANDAIQAVGEQIRKRLTKQGLNASAGLEVEE